MGLASAQLRSPLWVRFTDYFCHPFDAILNQSGQGWQTLKQRLDDEQIWQHWQDGDRLIGLGFGKTTRYALIDIDCGSPYHNEEGLRDITWALETIGINSTVLNQSSFSQGWHLYFGFSRPVATFALSCLLHQTMEAAGLTIAKGKLELFPNRKGWQKDAVTVYNRHRLPLQPASGSALLNSDLYPYSQDLGTFLNRLDDSAQANDIDLIEELATEAKRNYNPSKRKGTTGSPFTPHNPNARQWKKNLEEAIATGWTAIRQTHDLLGQIAEYGRVFLGHDDEHQLAEYIATTAIAAPGFIPYCRSKGEINAWALRWAKSAIRHRYPYGTRRGGKFKQLGQGGLTNEEKHIECLGRVSDAVADFVASGREWPKTIHARRNLLARMARCSERTLTKFDYLRLWHPNHLEIATDDGDRHADAVEASIHCPEQDIAIQDDAGSHPSNNVRSAFFSGSSNSEFPYPHSHLECFQNAAIPTLLSGCTSPGSIFSTETPQTHTPREIQPIGKKSPPKIVPSLGSWLIEPDRPHILLRLESIDQDGEWCRCQDAQQRKRELRGGLYALAELIPAQLAIAEATTPEEINP